MFFFISLIVLGLFVNGCKPAYVETPRPFRPSNKHIWINGDWVWNNRTKTYTRQESYWAIPIRKRNYTQGQWRSTHRGYYWKKSHWH